MLGIQETHLNHIDTCEICEGPVIASDGEERFCSHLSLKSHITFTDVTSKTKLLIRVKGLKVQFNID